MIHIPPGAPFPVRGFNLCESILRHTPEQLRTFIRRMKTLNMNTLIIHYDYGWKRYQQLILEECRKAGIQITLMTFGPRTFFSYSDWKKDFFAKDPQGQPYTNQLECETQPCRFVPEALAAFEFGAGQWLKSLPPEITRVHMRAGDGMMFCQCEKCRLLPEYERWQPFVECFVKAVQEKRPELEYETDIYYKRYRIPAEQAAFSSMKYIMYDTFFRKPSCPLSGPADETTTSLVQYADSTGCTSRETDAGAFHAARLLEWTQAFPGKLYIHENAMLQGYMGGFQYGTSSYLQDLLLFRKLNVQGVCYEAYEQGYQNFERMFEILAQALNGKEIFYEEHPLEKILPQKRIYRFCDDPQFSLEEHLSSPFEKKLQELYCRFWQTPDAALFRDFVTFALKNDGLLDPILVGWYCAAAGLARKLLHFKNLSSGASDFTTRRKLWDFMEDIPLSEDPVTVCHAILEELLSTCTPGSC